jgi:hypothetical protein
MLLAEVFADSHSDSFGGPLSLSPPMTDLIGK